MLKKSFCLLFALLTVFVLCSFSSDDTPDDNSDYSYTNECFSALNVSGLNGECVSHLLGYYGTTTKIVVKQYLQVRDGNRWRTAKDWTKTYYNYYCDFINNRTLYSGNTYRVYTEFKVYSGSNYETITTYSTSHSV